MASTSRQRSQGNVPTRSTGRAEIQKARSATAETRLSGLVKPLAKNHPPSQQQGPLAASGTEHTRPFFFSFFGIARSVYWLGADGACAADPRVGDAIYAGYSHVRGMGIP